MPKSANGENQLPNKSVGLNSHPNLALHLLISYCQVYNTLYNTHTEMTGFIIKIQFHSIWVIIN